METDSAIILKNQISKTTNFSMASIAEEIIIEQIKENLKKDQLIEPLEK